MRRRIARPSYAAGDVNGNCTFNGIDITFFVNYLRGRQPRILFCQDCPPDEARNENGKTRDLIKWITK